MVNMRSISGALLFAALLLCGCSNVENFCLFLNLVDSFLYFF